jgi:hypothetical protein
LASVAADNRRAGMVVALQLHALRVGLVAEAPNKRLPAEARTTEGKMSWSRDRQKIRTTYDHTTKRLLQFELRGENRHRFSVETFQDEAAAIKADDRLEVTWKDDWKKPRTLNDI